MALRCRRPRRPAHPQRPRPAAALRTRPESTPEIPARHRDQAHRHRETPGHRVRTRLLLAAARKAARQEGRTARPPGNADRGTARQTRRDTRASAMPGHRQRNRENRHQDRHRTPRPQHPEQAETPKVPGVEPKPLLVVICGLDKPFRTELSDADYRHVRDLGEEYLRRNPRSLA